MIINSQSTCPKCGGQLKYYDHVQRLIRTKYGNKKWVSIRRLRCCNCHSVHRELPDFIFPYKQYEADIIVGVYGENVYRPKNHAQMQENKKAALQFCKNAKRRTAIVHSYDIDFIPLVVYNIK